VYKQNNLPAIPICGYASVNASTVDLATVNGKGDKVGLGLANTDNNFVSNGYFLQLNLNNIPHEANYITLQFASQTEGGTFAIFGSHIPGKRGHAIKTGIISDERYYNVAPRDVTDQEGNLYPYISVLVPDGWLRSLCKSCGIPSGCKCIKRCDCKKQHWYELAEGINGDPYWSDVIDRRKLKDEDSKEDNDDEWSDRFGCCKGEVMCCPRSVTNNPTPSLG